VARIAIIVGLAHSLVNFRGPLIDALIAAGHSVVGLGPAAGPETLSWLAARGVIYHVIPLARASMSPTTDARTLNAMRSTLARVRADVVIAYTIKAVVYGLLAAKLAGVPRRYAMITGLGFAFTQGAGSLKRNIAAVAARGLYRLSLSQAHAVIFQNPDDLAVFRSLGLLGAHLTVGVVNGSGVDTARFAPAALPPGPHFLLIARLVADKGIGEYLAAARLVRELRPRATFALAGPEDPNPSVLPPGLLRQAIADGVVDYLGELDDVRPAINKASIYVLPSYREGTPRSVLEAMSMGRAVITTDAPGCRETVQDGVNGLLVPVKAVQELADAMVRLIDDPDQRARMGAAGRNMAVTKYRAEAVALSVLQLLQLNQTFTETGIDAGPTTGVSVTRHPNPTS
jgi:glycosyltransferase involved in cell wall biosynthesis